MAYAGLESIFQNEGPNSGAVTGGQREALAQSGDLLTQGGQVQALRQADIMNPLLAQYKQGEIDQQAPTLRKLNTEAQFGEDTLASKTSSTNAENESKFTKANYEKLAHVAQTAAAIGTQLQAIPEGFARDSAARQLLQQHGVPADSQAGQYVLNEGVKDPSKLLDIHKKIVEAGPAFMTKMAEENMKKDSHLQGIASINASNQLLEDKRIAAGKYDKKATASFAIKFMALSPDKQMLELAEALRKNINPFTGEALDATDRDALIVRYQQADAIVKANNAAKASGGIDVARTAGLPEKQVAPIAQDIRGPQERAAAPAQPASAVKPVPTPADRERAKSNPTSRANFIRHFGVEP
jgi:hypothetical protein